MSATPGPWTTLDEECDKPYIRVRGTRLGRRFKIANVLDPIYENVHPSEAEETRANARLIASAPDLLAACRRAVCALAAATVDDACYREDYEAVSAAIAKATGSAT
jgi:hypothetical protein